MTIEKLNEAVGAIKAHTENAQAKSVQVNHDFLIGKLVDCVEAIHAIELDRLTAPEPVKVEGEDPQQTEQV